MAQAIITRKGGASGGATITFDNVDASDFKHHEVSDLSVARYDLAATNIGDYALFAGGLADSAKTTVDAYDALLTRSTPSPPNNVGGELAATSIGNYAIFAGGYWAPYSIAYDTSLTKNDNISNLFTGGRGLAATSIGNYALFGGGRYYQSSAYHVSNEVDAYDASLTRTIPTALSVARCNLAATSVGNYALFAGGHNGSNQLNVVDAYDTSLTRTTPTTLENPTSSLAATSIDNYALFAGGETGINSNIINAYDTSLTRITAAIFSQARRDLAATSIGNYALFGGGGYSTNNSYIYRNTVEVYDRPVTRIITQNLDFPRSDLAATSIGNYAIFAGGVWKNSTYLSAVDAYSPTVDLSLFPGTKYKLNDMADEQTSDTFQTISVSTPLNGYLKIQNADIN